MGISEGNTGGHRQMPRVSWGCVDSIGCIGTVADCQKYARKVLSDALRGRSQGLNIADDRESMGCMGL
jgi:hypothetical protein